jgi:hypothetical protein
MGYSSQAAFRTTVSDWGQFAARDELRVSASTTKFYDGGSLTPYVLGGRALPQEFEVRRQWDAARDMPLVKRFVHLVGRSWHQVTFQPTDEDLAGVGEPLTFRALLTDLRFPSHDANTQNNPQPAMLVLRLDPAGVTVA